MSSREYCKKWWKQYCIPELYPRKEHTVEKIGGRGGYSAMRNYLFFELWYARFVDRCGRENVDAAKFEYLYTFYGIPPMVLSLFGGVLVDKVLGLTRSSYIAVLIAISGQIVITIGGFTELFWVMVLGRFISGIGTETFIVCLNCYIIICLKIKKTP